jgi:hypothetical protein
VIVLVVHKGEVNPELVTRRSISHTEKLISGVGVEEGLA